jgi:hypothetical protein
LTDCATIEYFLNPVCDWSVKGSPGFRPEGCYIHYSEWNRSDRLNSRGLRSGFLWERSLIVTFKNWASPFTALFEGHQMQRKNQQNCKRKKCNRKRSLQFLTRLSGKRSPIFTISDINYLSWGKLHCQLRCCSSVRQIEKPLLVSSQNSERTFTPA